MTESKKILPKKDIRRSAIARQIGEARYNDEYSLYENSRDGRMYIRDLLGIQHLFDYARSQKDSSLVLDIGAGVTLGTRDLSLSILGRGLKFEATVVKRLPNDLNFLGEENTHITSVETLRRIVDRSVVVVLGVFSVGYSADPNLAVAGIDRILIPGGVFKGTFYKGDLLTAQSPIGFKTYHKFDQALKQLGYDSATSESGPMADILLAIKPGGIGHTRASQLIEEDEQTYKDQEAIMTAEKTQRGEYPYKSNSPS